jgi:DNA (cytosine-5)-methyltransferase 1
MKNDYGYVPTMKEINSLKKSFNVISTFSGIGGSSLGYKMAGLDVKASVEFLDYQARTYRENHKSTKLYEGDIRKIDPLNILKDVGLEVGQLDILDGSPPCSAFSTAGKRQDGWGEVKKYGNRKQRVDDLFFEYTRFLKIIQPKVFVAENVSGLVKGKAKGYFKIILKELKYCGYNVKAKLLNAKYYGVPQSRQRLIFIGVRNDLNIAPCFPLANNKIINSDQVNKDYNEIKLGGRKFNWQSASRIHPTVTQTKTSITAYLSGGEWVRQSGGKPRRLTIDEFKRIVSLPEDFRLLGNFNDQWEGCGRLVPPLMMRAIAENIKNNILNLL